MEVSQTKNKRFRILSEVAFFLSLIGTTVFLVLVSLSHVYAIRNGYDWTYWELSELVLYGNTAKILFNVGVIVDGILLVPILIILSRYFIEKSYRISYLVISSLTCFSLIGLGAFSEDVFVVTHYIFGTMFFVFCSILIGFISVYLIRKMKTIEKIYPIMGFIILFALVFHLATRWLFGMAFTQRIAIVFSLIFLLVFAGRLVFTQEKNLSGNAL